MKRALGIFLTILIIMPEGLIAASRPIVVVPLHDNVSDNISDDLTESFAKSFAKNGFNVVSSDKVEAVVSYYQPVQKRDDVDEVVKEAEDSIARAKEHYYNFDYEEAVAQIQRALKILELDSSNISRNGEILRDAYVSAGIIEKSVKTRDRYAAEYFQKVLLIDPLYKLDDRAFSPSIVTMFKKLQEDISKKPSGEIKIETDPKAAEVFVNGILKGVSPVTISGLPEGRYNLAIKTNKYKEVVEDVEVKSGQTVKVSKKLWWNGNEKNHEDELRVLGDESREQIKEGLRIAELLRVPKVVLVDVDEGEKGTGTIYLRMVDRRLKAGQNPVIVSYSQNKKGLSEDLSNASSILVSQYGAEILKNPTKYIDPDGIGDPVLLGKRKKALYTMPVFWGVVGGILAATAGGAAAAVATSGGGSSSDTGSVNVQFK